MADRPAPGRSAGTPGQVGQVPGVAGAEALRADQLYRVFATSLAIRIARNPSPSPGAPGLAGKWGSPPVGKLRQCLPIARARLLRLIVVHRFLLRFVFLYLYWKNQPASKP